MFTTSIKSQLQEKLKQFATITEDASMKKHTTMKVGGTADFFIEPNCVNDIQKIVNILKEFSIPMKVLGNGSNVIVGDRGINGVVLHIGKTCDKVKVEGNEVIAEAGISISKLINVAIENNLKGLEIVAGIPGTLGGAIYMNASYTKPISQVLKSVTVLRGSEVVVLKKEELAFGYRKSIFHTNDDIILSARLILSPGDMSDIVKKYLKSRKSRQPVHLPNCGSVFKKPGKYVYNLKEISVNDAVYDRGFILNKGEATALDVYNVIEKIKSRTKKTLELEAELIGDFSMDIGIVTSFYNGYDRFIERWAKSICKLTIKPSVAVMVISGPEENPEHVKNAEKMFAERGIYYISWKIDEHQSMGHARNKAVELSNTEWVMYLDVDDTIRPKAIEYFQKYEKNADVICSGLRIVGARKNKSIIYSNASTARQLKGKVCGSSHCPFRKKFWKMRPFITKNDYIEQALKLGFAQHGARFVPTKEICTVYHTRKNGHNLSMTPEQWRECREQKKKFLREGVSDD